MVAGNWIFMHPSLFLISALNDFSYQAESTLAVINFNKMFNIENNDIEYGQLVKPSLLIKVDD